MQRTFILETRSKNLPIACKTHLKNISYKVKSPLKKLLILHILYGPAQEKCKRFVTLRNHLKQQFGCILGYHNWNLGHQGCGIPGTQQLGVPTSGSSSPQPTDMNI